MKNLGRCQFNWIKILKLRQHHQRLFHVVSTLLLSTRHSSSAQQILVIIVHDSWIYSQYWLNKILFSLIVGRVIGQKAGGQNFNILFTELIFRILLFSDKGAPKYNSSFFINTRSGYFLVLRCHTGFERRFFISPKRAFCR